MKSNLLLIPLAITILLLSFVPAPPSTSHGRSLKRGSSRSRRSSFSFSWKPRTTRYRYSYMYYGVIGGACLKADTECMKDNRRRNGSMVIPVVFGSFCCIVCIVYTSYDCSVKQKEPEIEWKVLFDGIEDMSS